MHAEANAIAYAARNGVATSDAYLYTTHMPCFDCARLIINAGIRAVIYYIPYRNQSGLDLLGAAGVETFRLSASYSLIQVR
jgi:dCMP deaminase